MQHNVNFRPNQADNEAADDDEEADNEAADDLATIQEDEQATVQEKESVPLKVIEASVLMPHDSLKVFRPKHAYEPYLIQITGDRYVSGQRRKRSYYLATYNADDCHQLVKVLESRKNNVKLNDDPEEFDESVDIGINPMAEPAPAEAEEDSAKQL